VIGRVYPSSKALSIADHEALERAVSALHLLA
jgi:hypothetical protein